MTPAEWRALWATPIMPAKSFAESLGLTASGFKKFAEAADVQTYRIGGIEWVKPLEVAHAARGWKSEVSK